MRRIMVSLLIPWVLLGGGVRADEDADYPSSAPMAEDLAALGAESRALGAPILIMFSAAYCDYCQRLESEVINPLARSKADQSRVIVRKVMMDGYRNLRDFDGKELEPNRFAYRYHVYGTPTLVLIDGSGRELVPKIAGYQTPPLFPAYLEQAIDASQKLLSTQ